jgi:hypothetical protein
MTEEIKQEVAVTPQVEDHEGNEEGSQPELTEVEQRALEMGWKPKTDFNGDDDTFVDAKEFVSRKPLFDRIEHQSRELKEVRKALKALGDHHQKVREVEYQEALKSLRNEKKNALESGDADRLIEIDDRIAEEKARQVVAQNQAQNRANDPHPEFVNWVKENTWYVADQELRQVADQVGTAHAAANPNLTPEEVLQYVKGRVKRLFPEKFNNPNKERPSAVEGSSRAPTRSTASNKDTFTLSEDERRVMNTFIRSGVLTKEQYISDLKKVKGIA